MKFRKPAFLLAACAGAIVFVASALVGIRASQALSPCRPFQSVQLTGSLHEVRRGDTVIPNEQAILDGLPRSVCLSPTDTNHQTTVVTVTDCDFPQYSVNATLVP